MSKIVELLRNIRKISDINGIKNINIMKTDQNL